MAQYARFHAVTKEHDDGRPYIMLEASDEHGARLFGGKSLAIEVRIGTALGEADQLAKMLNGAMTGLSLS